MFSALPNDIARHITKVAIGERNEDVLDQIRNTVACVFEFAATEKCGFVETPLFVGSSKFLHITKFSENKLLESRGMKTLSVTFWLHVDEFELTKHTYFMDDKYEEETDYSLFIIDKQGKYGNVVAEVFGHIFENAIVY